MTAEDADEGHASAAQSAVALDGLHGIFGTSRHVAAGWGQNGRDGPLVGPQQLQRDEFGEVAQVESVALASCAREVVASPSRSVSTLSPLRACSFLLSHP